VVKTEGIEDARCGGRIWRPETGAQLDDHLNGKVHARETNLETTETGAKLDDHLNGKVHARETNLETTETGAQLDDHLNGRCTPVRRIWRPETGAQCGMRGESS